MPPYYFSALQEQSDRLLCAARVTLQQDEASANDQLKVNTIARPDQVKNSGLYTDAVDERTTCTLKPGLGTTCGNTGPQLFDPCALMWIPTKNRTAPPPCSRPAGTLLDAPQPCFPADRNPPPRDWCLRKMAKLEI